MFPYFFLKYFMLECMAFLYAVSYIFSMNAHLRCESFSMFKLNIALINNKGVMLCHLDSSSV